MPFPKIPTPKQAPFYWVVGAILVIAFLAAVFAGCGPISFAQEPAQPVGTVSSPARCTCTSILPPAAPIPLVPSDAWIAHYGLSYWRDPLGTVHMQGSVSSANGTDVPVTILPIGYRPTSYRTFAATEAYPGVTSTARVEVDPDGTVSVTPIRVGAVISLDGIEFLAAP